MITSARTRLVGLVMLLGLLVLITTNQHHALARVHRLSMSASGNVREFQISTDNRFVVYSADRDGQGHFDLYSVSRDGGASTRLTPPTLLAFEFAISPDSTQVVYKGIETPGVGELYSVPITGTVDATVKLNGPLATVDDDVYGFRISPDSRRVLYQVTLAGTITYYSVPTTGPAAASIQLSAFIPGSPIETAAYAISPDSSRVVYVGPQTTAGISELYSVPIDGPVAAAVRLNPVPPLVDAVHAFQISPDSTKVVYTAFQSATWGIYRVPIAGGASVQINQIPLPFSSWPVPFRISANAAWVIYNIQDQNDRTTELYRVPIDGPISATVKLNGPIGAGSRVADYAVSPDSQRVVFRLDQPTIPVFPTFYTYTIVSVPLSGPASAGVLLYGPIVYNPNQDTIEPIQISADSHRVVFRVPLDTPTSPQQLYSAPIAGPAAAVVKLSESPTGWHFELSPDSARVIFQANDLYTVGISGGPNIKLNDPMVFAGQIFDFQVRPDSREVVYRADQDTLYKVELYSSDNRPRAFYMPLVHQ
jgi:hypothetical protein